MFRAHEFAQLAGITVKALHHYDRLGLLKPRRNHAGYRLYSEQDLPHLEQIVALKFLGLPLKQIKALLDRGALGLPEALGLQRRILEEKRARLDRAIGAIERAEGILQSGASPGPAAIKEIIEAIEMHIGMQNDIEFMKNYYRDEAWTSFRAHHRDWPSRAWSDLFRDITAARGEDPAGAKARNLAARWRKLRVADSGGDVRVHQGLIRAWADRQFWPEAVQQQFAEFDFEEISRFVAAAFAAYRVKRFGEMPWNKELNTFTPEEKARFPLAVADLSFKLEAAAGEDPAGKTAQALAARWMELMESRTGGGPDPSAPPGAYESYLRWMESWPPAIYQQLRAMHQKRVPEFILKAIAVPMR
jgi:DNA-binding transcriptional MerR regulator